MNFRNRNHSIAVFAGWVGFALVAASTVSAANRKPNILFIGVDDLRPELNCYGATHIKSPRIDRLAAEGVLFERAYCQWAVCMPSRASLLSGLRPDTFQGKANAFREVVPDVVTLPQHFKNHGYFAQSFGKIYHGSWETAYVGNSYQDPVSWSVKRWAASPQYYFSPEGIRAAKEVFATSNDKFLRKVKRDPTDPDQWTRHFVRGPATEAPDVPDNVPADGAIAEAARERLREVVARENAPPFFLAVGFQKPHLPFVAPRKYWDLYDPEKIPPVSVPDKPEGAPEFSVQAGATELNQYLEKNRGLVSPERTRHLRHGYAACVSYVDAQVGLLLDELDRLGVRDNTIVVLWSDHGYKLGDFSSWAKHTNFELDTRVPLIVSAPGLAKGKRCEALVELVDLHPTLSELAGLPIHPGADGESFAANVKAPGDPGQDAAFSQYPKGGYMGYTVRTATHRYTEWREKNGAIAAKELYEYGADGIERTNLADQPKHAGIQETLQQRLSANPDPSKPKKTEASALKQERGDDSLIQVGVARVDITPTEPIRLSGYRVRSEPTDEVEGKLWAKALAIGSDEQKPSVLITVELVGITRTMTDALAERLTDLAGVTRDRLAVCVTHTHSGPFVKGNLPHIFGKPIPAEHQEIIDRYATELGKKLTRVALEALRNRKPARLSWSQGSVDFAANRRAGYLLRAPGKDARISPPVDHDLPALFVHGAEGNLHAVLLSYACHCTTLSGGNFNRIHGDWAGEASLRIEDQYPGAVAMVAIGCGADQNPDPRGLMENVKAHGQQIADEIGRMLGQPGRLLNSTPQCCYRIAELPFGKLPSESDLQKRLQSKTERVRYYAQVLLDRKSRGIEPPRIFEYPIQTWTFGQDLAMVFLPGEIVVDYGLRLKRELDADRLWVNGYSNDVPCYIASARVIGEGGYEVDTSMDSYDKPTRFDPSVENIIIEKVHELLPEGFREEKN